MTTNAPMVYRALVGLSYRPQGSDQERRVEPGEIAEDLPRESVPWLLALGYVERIDVTSTRGRAPSRRSVSDEAGI